MKRPMFVLLTNLTITLSLSVEEYNEWVLQSPTTETDNESSGRGSGRSRRRRHDSDDWYSPGGGGVDGRGRRGGDQQLEQSSINNHKKPIQTAEKQAKPKSRFQRSVEDAIDEYKSHLEKVRPSPPKKQKSENEEDDEAEVSFKVPAHAELSIEELEAKESVAQPAKDVDGQPASLPEEGDKKEEPPADGEAKVSDEKTPDDTDNEETATESVVRKKKPRKKAFRLSTKTNKSKKDAVVDVGDEAPATRRSLRSNTPKEVVKGKRNRQEEIEKCLYEDCTRQFSSYFGMMRHVAFNHRHEETAQHLKLKLTPHIESC